MADYLRKLRKLMPPPADPVESSGDWKQAEKDLGTRLPADYKQFVEEYGRGCLFDYIHIFTTFPTDPRGGLKNEVKRIFGGYKIVTEEYPEAMPYPLFPEKGGLLPFAQSEVGNELCWVTNGTPNRWLVMFVSIGSERYEQYDCSFVEFLCGIISRELRCGSVPEEVLDYEPKFVPFKHPKRKR